MPVRGFSADRLPALTRWARVWREPSLANGWLGAHWVKTKLVRARLMPADARHDRLLERWLARSQRIAGPERRSSHLVGAGALPVVLAYVARDRAAWRGRLAVAMRAWMRICERSEKRDVIVGAAGALLAAAEIETVLPDAVPTSFAQALQRQTRDALRDNLGAPKAYLGMAHGIAGYLFALETAAATFGVPCDLDLRDRVIALLASERFEAPGRMAAWPCVSGEPVTIHGWCHGAPGIGLALLACHALSGHAAYRSLAELALNATWAFASPASTFCCGAIGRAQVLVEAYRLTGERRWLRKARAVADDIRFAAHGASSLGFHRGWLGFEYLRARITAPDRLPLPGLGQLSAGP